MTPRTGVRPRRNPRTCGTHITRAPAAPLIKRGVVIQHETSGNTHADTHTQETDFTNSRILIITFYIFRTVPIKFMSNKTHVKSSSVTGHENMKIPRCVFFLVSITIHCTYNETLIGCFLFLCQIITQEKKYCEIFLKTKIPIEEPSNLRFVITQFQLSCHENKSTVKHSGS